MGLGVSQMLRDTCLELGDRESLRAAGRAGCEVGWWCVPRWSLVAGRTRGRVVEVQERGVCGIGGWKQQLHAAAGKNSRQRLDKPCLLANVGRRPWQLLAGVGAGMDDGGGEGRWRWSVRQARQRAATRVSACLELEPGPHRSAATAAATAPSNHQPSLHLLPLLPASTNTRSHHHIPPAIRLSS